jgi:hypothetical protein
MALHIELHSTEILERDAAGYPETAIPAKLEWIADRIRRGFLCGNITSGGSVVGWYEYTTDAVEPSAESKYADNPFTEQER